MSGLRRVFTQAIGQDTQEEKGQAGEREARRELRVAKEWPKYTKFTPTPTLDNFPLTAAKMWKMEMFVCRRHRHRHRRRRRRRSLSEPDRESKGGKTESEWGDACQWANGRIVFVSKPKATYDMCDVRYAIHGHKQQHPLGVRVCVRVCVSRMPKEDLVTGAQSGHIYPQHKQTQKAL